MAGNFAFKPAGISSLYTVGGAAPVTTSLNVQPIGQTGTVGITTGGYTPSGIRLVNNGTQALFVLFAPSAATATNAVALGMQMLATSVESFSFTGPFLSLACARTFTVTVAATLGEGV